LCISGLGGILVDKSKEMDPYGTPLPPPKETNYFSEKKSQWLKIHRLGDHRIEASNHRKKRVGILRFRENMTSNAIHGIQT